MIAKAIGGKPPGKRIRAIATGDKHQNTGCRDAAQHLNEPVGQHFLGRMASAEDEPEGHRGVQMTAGHVADGICHRDDGQAKGQGDAHEANANVRERGCQHGASATPENQPKSSNELCCKLSGQWHSRLLSFICFSRVNDLCVAGHAKKIPESGPRLNLPPCPRHSLDIPCALALLRPCVVLGEVMLSILVCQSYFLRLDQKQISRTKPYPPLATSQVVSLLPDAGHQAPCFDAT